MRAVETKERQDIVFGAGVDGDALFEEEAELLPKAGEFFGIVGGEVVDLFDEATRQRLANARGGLSALEHLA